MLARRSVPFLQRANLRAAACLAPQHQRLCSSSKAVGESLAENTKASTFTGTPVELLSRTVKIFQPAQGVQNANQNTQVWKIQWEDA